jgi:hypothetical protein
MFSKRLPVSNPGAKITFLFICHTATREVATVCQTPVMIFFNPSGTVWTVQLWENLGARRNFIQRAPFLVR